MHQVSHGAEATTDLGTIIEHAAHLLPAQGPIDVFIHHNTLHAFEDLPFEEAVVEAARVFGSEPFLSEDRYRRELDRGRIRAVDIDAVLADERAGREEPSLAGGRVALRSLHRLLLLHDVRQESDAEVRWTLTESDVLERLREDLAPEVRWKLVTDGGEAGTPPPETGMADAEDEKARRSTLRRAAGWRSRDAERRAASDLWQACLEAVAVTRPTLVHTLPPVRHRDLIHAVDPTLDTDALVHPALIRWCAAYLDQGVAGWMMPGRQAGILAAVSALHAGRGGPVAAWAARLPEALRASAGRPALEVIATELARLGIPPEHHAEFINQSLLALRGWAGMIRQFEERPDRAPVESVPARVADFVALRLVCDRVATEWAARRLGKGRVDLPALWVELRDRSPPRRGPGSLARAFLLHQVSQLVGLTGRELRGLDENELLAFENAIASFDSITRRRLFHLAYERRYRHEVLDALAGHVAVAAEPLPGRPQAQLVLCIDERCESFRRHFEEMGPGHETFGTAGFFAVPMYYRGLDDWHASPLCPIVVRPRHTVVEVPEADDARHHALRQSLRRRYGQLSGSLDAGSRTLLRGGLLTALAGTVAAVPLVARVLFPRLAARVGAAARDLGRRRIVTRLALERSEEPALVPDTSAGFELGEMVAIVRRVLEDIGLRDRFARLVGVLGHGSSSRNNPHESAYDCGACGGGRGGPNARAFATMANDPRVRERLAATGLVIPADTRFVGGLLDTCADVVTWYDIDLLPGSHADDMEQLRIACVETCAANAHERCRRFESAPLDIVPLEAQAHVEARSVDLAQVRPELGHATNAACIIGRRWRTRGLFLDRRAFLVSYDPITDPDTAILARTLAAVGPVGAGINLEYYFSIVDRLNYGAGTKLPHNITGLIGVMDGHASDLRTGLPWQMVEIHEPVRLLVVVDATPEAILRAAAGVPAVGRLVTNRWIQIAAWHPLTGELFSFVDGQFRPHQPESGALPVVERSRDWYAGRRDHLPPARILAGLSRAPLPVRGVGHSSATPSRD